MIKRKKRKREKSKKTAIKKRFNLSAYFTSFNILHSSGSVIFHPLSLANAISRRLYNTWSSFLSSPTRGCMKVLIPFIRTVESCPHRCR